MFGFVRLWVELRVIGSNVRCNWMMYFLIVFSIVVAVIDYEEFFACLVFC